MNGVTESVSTYIKQKGISITAISDKTGLTYGAIYPSLCSNPVRKLRADELLAICDFLCVDPRDFYLGGTNGKGRAS